MIDDHKLSLDKIVAFLLAIGLQVRQTELTHQTFLPGIDITHGTILIDESKLTYPGDLLHEAGHLAVISAAQRNQAVGDFNQAADELMAIAWSYAALVHLNLAPAVVFHANGYKGWSAALIENFTNGRYIGVPMLQWIGLTADAQRAAATGVAPYPAMIKWLLE